jgi:nitroreductase
VFICGLNWILIGVYRRTPQGGIEKNLSAASIRFFEIASMNLHALAMRCARIAPKKIHVAFPFLIMAVLYWLSALPGTPLPDDPEIYALFYWISPSLQNALHVPAYAALAWAWHWALRAWLRVSGAQAIGACAIASAYGVFDEWHQSFVPGRYASFTDVVLDVAGAALGIWLAAWASRYMARSAAAVAPRDPQAR